MISISYSPAASRVVFGPVLSSSCSTVLPDFFTRTSTLSLKLSTISVPVLVSMLMTMPSTATTRAARAMSRDRRRVGPWGRFSTCPATTDWLLTCRTGMRGFADVGAGRLKTCPTEVTAFSLALRDRVPRSCPAHHGARAAANSFIDSYRSDGSRRNARSMIAANSSGRSARRSRIGGADCVASARNFCSGVLRSSLANGAEPVSKRYSVPASA